MSLDFTTASGLRILLTELHYAGPGAWRHDPDARALMRYATDKYASLATKHGLEPDDAAYAAFNVLRTDAVRKAHDPWAVTTRAVQVTLIYDERANGLLCSTYQARRAEISAHHDADRLGDHETSLLDYHPAFHVQPEVDTLDEDDSQRPPVTVHEAFEMTVRLFTALGWPEHAVRHGPLRHTIARQVSLLLRRAAIASGAPEIRITDTHSGRGIVEVLQRDGFEFDPTTAGSNDRRDNVAYAIKVCAPWVEVRGLVDPHGAAGLEIQVPEASAAAEYERIWWPANIADAALPTWIVPIRSVFADELLGHVPTLLARDEDLGLSREHVYYRSGQSQPSAPGRVIWYASDRDMAVVNCSRLTHSLLGTPEALHRAFRQFGVWGLDQVRDVADKRGLVNALRFADTEIFSNPLPLGRLRRLSERGARFTVQDPTSISGDQFSRLYQEATR